MYNSIANTGEGALFLAPSDVYVRSFFYPFYTLIKLYYTKALSDQASSLALDWILLLQRPRIPASLCDSATTFHLGASSGILQDKMSLIIYVSLLLLTPKIFLSLPFDPQDNAFLSWAHSYAAFHNRSNCWVCGALPSSSLTRWTLVGKVMSLLLNIQSRLVITFLPRSVF